MPPSYSIGLLPPALSSARLLRIFLARIILLLPIVIFNFYLFRWYEPHAGGLPAVLRFILLAFWFCCNFWFLRSMQAGINRLFNRTRFHLEQAEVRLIDEIMVLRKTDGLAKRLTSTICNVLPYTCAQIYVFDEKRSLLEGPEENRVTVAPSLARRMAICSDPIEKQFMQAQDGEERAALDRLLRDLSATVIIPLVQDDFLVGVLALPEKQSGKPATPDEAIFLRNISRKLALAISNAMMYQSLQAKTDALARQVRELLAAEQNLQCAQAELEALNQALEQAILQANEMTVRLEISNHELVRQMEDRKRTESALRQSEATYRMIAECSTDVIYTHDLKGRFTFISPSVYHQLGYTPEEILARPISSVLTAESYKVATEFIAEELERARNPDGVHRKSRSTQFEQVRKDGTKMWTEVNTRFITDKDRKIIGILGVARDITERKKSEQDLIYMAYFDELTGLYNRKAFTELLYTEIKYAQRYQSGLCLLFFDLNKFKLVNDTYGHEIGDRLLKAVADRLKRVIRETDVVARIGGDEFVLILKNPEKFVPDTVARRIVRDLSKPFELAGIRIDFVTASMGIATFPKDGTTVAALMKSADLAMYEAKKNSAEWVHFDESVARPL